MYEPIGSVLEISFQFFFFKYMSTHQFYILRCLYFIWIILFPILFLILFFFFLFLIRVLVALRVNNSLKSLQVLFLFLLFLLSFFVAPILDIKLFYYFLFHKFNFIRIDFRVLYLFHFFLNIWLFFIFSKIMY